MKYLSFLYLSVVACISLFFLLVLNFNPPERRNICNVAEISPDVTQKEREECRMIRGHKLQIMKQLLEILPKILGMMPEIVKYIKYIPILLILAGVGYGVYYASINMKDPYKCYNNQLFEQKSLLSNVYIFKGDTCVDGEEKDQNV